MSYLETCIKTKLKKLAFLSPRNKHCEIFMYFLPVLVLSWETVGVIKHSTAWTLEPDLLATLHHAKLWNSDSQKFLVSGPRRCRSPQLGPSRAQPWSTPLCSLTSLPTMSPVSLELFADKVAKTAENFHAPSTGGRGFGYKGSCFQNYSGTHVPGW